AANYVKLATSRATAEAAADELGLDVSPSSLAGRISVEQPADTVLLEITARASTPRAAQQLADAWVEALADQVREIEDPQGRERAGTPQVRPIEAAELPSAPVSPDPIRNLAIGLALGLLLAFAYAMLR